MREDLEDYRVRPLAKIIYGNLFELTIVFLIVANAAILGILTYPTIPVEVAETLTRLDFIIYLAFVVEIGLRIASFGRKPWRFFQCRWNVFDFLVVALVPIFSSATLILRLLRLLRILRLFRFMPEFQMLSNALGRTIKPVGSAFLLIALFVFIYAMAGVYVFGEHDPDHWETLGSAMVTLTILLTLENFPETLESGLEHTPWAWLYFVSFMVIVVFTILNVLIGIVLNAMEESRRQFRTPPVSARDVDSSLRLLEKAIDDGEIDNERLEMLRHLVEQPTVKKPTLPGSGEG
jgi:voltage-gated sodium channel